MSKQLRELQSRKSTLVKEARSLTDRVAGENRDMTDEEVTAFDALRTRIDAASARAMQVSVRSNVPAQLSVLVTVGYFAILIGMMFDVLKVKDSQALLLMLGSLTTGWGVVMAFWFGTTNDSGRKTELLARAGSAK